jgi:pesticin/yersiniabactin receptor
MHHMRHTATILTTTLSTALLTFVPANARAHTGAAKSAAESKASVHALAPITVEASKQGLSLSNIDNAVIVRTAEELDDAQVTSVSDLERVFPGVQFSYGANFLYPTIGVRGIPSVQDFYNPALTVYVDGVPQLPSFAYQSLLDVEQIELLKGPQGTLYGKSAEGGILNIVTRKPDNVPRLRLRSGVSSHGGYETLGSAAGPLVRDLLYGSVSLSANNTPGDLHSPETRADHLGGVRSQAGRVRLRLAPAGSRWEAGISAVHDCARGHQDVYTYFDQIASREAVVSPEMPAQYHAFYQHRCANGVAANGQYDFDDWRLTAALGWQHLDVKREYPLGPYYPQAPEQWKQNTQEVRLGTRTHAGRAWDAVFGLYRQQVNQTRSSRFDLIVPSYQRLMQTESKNSNESLAGYSDITWHVTPRLDLSGGLRLSRDSATTRFAGRQAAEPFAGHGSTHENTWLGKLSAGYQWTPEWRTYATASQGYKPRGFNLAPSSPTDTTGFARERAMSYELGARYTGADVRASMALYRIDIRAAQMYGDDNMGYQTLQNAGDTRSTGVEASAEWDITRAWTLAASAFLSEATFQRYTGSSHCAECAGNDVPFAPPNGFTLAARGRLPVGDTLLRPQVALRRIGSHYFDNANTLRQDSYTLVDASLAWSPKRNLEIALFVHNLTNRDYRGYAFSFEPLGKFAQVAPGRVVGMNLTYDY